jgi:fatty acid desaturase
MAIVYEINKGVNRSVEFKGIKAQYISYLAIGLVLLLLAFALLYAFGLGVYYSLAVIIPIAAAFIMVVQHLSKAYGEHGLTRRMAARNMPHSIQSRTATLFSSLKTTKDGTQQNA